ncbi:hypothetical protein HMPREF9723_02178 [Treponema denticola OTK]|uniref:Resolvase/invertase-type recombinase catalytic domain-containing protein n=1 Tax=Treponema denticola OTK TaxID=999434 RepID=A0A0F6MND8_TREDN|nr:recombinase family protein [Treponema denticola]EMB20718.1 hypothetical protein HMPREF9723_02178 [Treponema denticola OTK]
MLAIYARTSTDKAENSTIEQQVKAGIEFASKNNMNPKVFQDKGVSGYKIEEDENKNPFENRPAFTQMIEDIKKGTIDAVWVWEHSRISRNQYASAYIFNIFSKYKIRLYEKDKEYDLNDPNTQLLRTMLDAVAQYERQLIVKRTTRGLHNAIDNGKRSYPSLLGYRKTIKNSKGNYIWEPVESELLQVKNWFTRYKNGESLKNIVFSQNSNENKASHILKRTTHLSRTLQHYVYTGYSLNTKGLDYLKKFDNFEIDNLQMLHNPDYWVKSIPYSLEIINREDWIEVKERLRIYKEKHKKNTNRRAEKSIGTGLITCGYCGAKFFYQVQAHKRKKGLVLYPYYFHMSCLDRTCLQSPKSVSQDKIDTIFKIFVLYSTITSDSKSKFLKERLFQEDIEVKAIKEKVKILKRDHQKTETQISKFKTALETTEDVGAITVLAKQIDNTETTLTEIKNSIISGEAELQERQEAMNKTRSQLMHYSICDLLTQFFEKWNIEEQRNHLLKIVDNAVITGTTLNIKSGEYTYIFDTNKKYEFPTVVYNEMLKEAKEDIDYSSFFRNKPDDHFERRMWSILVMSESVWHICEWRDKEKQLIF